MKLRSLAFLVVAILVGASPALAQHTSPTDMHLPADSVATCNGPLCLAFNPAGLHWSPSAELIYLHEERWSVDGLPAGGADGLLVSTDALGFAIQYVRPDRARATGDFLKYTLALKLFSVGDHFAAGVGLEILDPTETDEGVSFDVLVGAMVRPWRYMSFGLVGRGLAQAEMAGVRAERSLDLGLAIRPLWFAPERLTLAADYRFIENTGDPALRMSLQASVVEGVRLFGSVDLDGHFGAGLMIDFLRFGAGGYTLFGNRDEIQNEGLVLMARTSLDNRPGIRVLTERTVEIVLGGDLENADRPPRALFKRRTTLRDVELAIRQATRDERVDSLLIKLEAPDMGITRVQELRAALAVFKAAGKKVAFHLESATNLNYYLASIGDAIYLSPAGSLSVTGPRVEALFFGGTLGMVGVTAEAHQAGKYKNAPDMFTRQEPSQAHQEVLESLADEYADQIFSAIADGRGLARGQVEVLVDQGLMVPPQAEEAGLIDGVLHYDEINDRLADLLGHRAHRMGGYLSERWHSERWGSLPRVAVVHATGGIGYGRGGVGSDMDARAIAETLNALASDAGVEAVVLRIDSPGGSGLASDLMWREVFRLRQRKPVIVSMGAVAASGGYYIACPADWILAEPATITGSIGVFALMIDASELWARLGISREAVTRGKLADLYTSFRGRTPEERELLQKIVDTFYEGFVDRVAEGRKQDRDKIHAVAQGRVWTGRQAKEHGLVDELGGLSRALELARERIGLEPDAPIQVVHLPKQRLGLGWVLGQLGLQVDSGLAIPAMLRTPLEQMLRLSTLSAEPTLALLPFFSLTVK